MRWEDERYVKLFTRDTIDFLALSLEAQGLFSLIMRKVDRAGIIRLGRHGARGVAAIIGHAARWETIEPALQELLADGCVKVVNDKLVIPNFVAAQEAKASENQRKRDQRERDRDKALAETEGVAAEVEEVTPDGHAEVSRPDVTPGGHAGESRPEVTPSLALLDKEKDMSSSTTSDPSGKPEPPSPPEGLATASAVLSALTPPAPRAPDLAQQVFEHWRRVMRKGPRTQFDKNRRAAVEKQLKAGRSVAEICKAIDGCAKSAFNMGDNDRGKPFNDLELICRDAKRLEGFLELADGPTSQLPAAQAGPKPRAPGIEQTAAMLEAQRRDFEQSRSANPIRPVNPLLVRSRQEPSA